MTSSSVGPLMLVGGSEWTQGCDFDAQILDSLPGRKVVILPTAQSYENPFKALEKATQWFSELGSEVEGAMILSRKDAQDKDNLKILRKADLIYISDGSPLHLRSVLKDSLCFELLLQLWHQGVAIAGAGAGAMVLVDPMVDPRGGAFTVGLGMVEQLGLIPNFEEWSQDKVNRTLSLMPQGIPLVGLSNRSALIRNSNGIWQSAGVGKVHFYLNRNEVSLEDLSLA